MAKKRYTDKLGQQVKDLLGIEAYKRMWNELSQAERNKADWYLVRLAVKAAQDKEGEQAHFLFDRWLDEVSNGDRRLLFLKEKIRRYLYRHHFNTYPGLDSHPKYIGVLGLIEGETGETLCETGSLSESWNEIKIAIKSLSIETAELIKRKIEERNI